MVYIIILLVGVFAFQGPISSLLRYLLTVNGLLGGPTAKPSQKPAPASPAPQASKPEQSVKKALVKAPPMATSQHRDTRISDIERQLAGRLLRIPSDLRAREHTGLYELISMTSGQLIYVRDEHVQALVHEWVFLTGVSVCELEADEAARHFTGILCAA